jgi:hypothetical protein
VALFPVRVEEATGAGDLAGEVVGVGVGGHVRLRIADFGLGIVDFGFPGSGSRIVKT